MPVPILKVFEFNTNINSNTSEFEKGYQYWYQYLRSLNSITIPISIPKFFKFNIKLKTIPKYLDSRYFAISRQYQKRSSRYRAFMAFPSPTG